jgi:hypothetical protein
MSGEAERFYNHLDIAGDASILKIAASPAGNALTLSPAQRFVDVDLGNAAVTADITLTLPNASQMRGKTVSVFVSTSDATHDVVVVGPGVGTNYNSGDLDTALDVVVLYSDGLRWIAIHTDAAH